MRVALRSECFIGLAYGQPSAFSTYRCDLRRNDTDYPQQDGTSGELFAQVNYISPYTQVEPVLDSSRYFVLRVEGEGGKRAYIGMGFEERGDAFDFQVSKSTPAQCLVCRPSALLHMLYKSR